MIDSEWNRYYTKDKSVLSYPDENLVRLIKKNFPEKTAGMLHALDLGCGTGRHLQLLHDCGFGHITGTDNSFNAVKISSIYPCYLINSDNLKIPLKKETIDLTVAWGSLHYNKKSDLPLMLDEIKNILKKEGHFFATLRSDRDTHMKRGRETGNNEWITDLNDISGSSVSFYSEDELKKSLSVFSFFEYGLIERTIIGDLNKTISHWIISAKK